MSQKIVRQAGEDVAADGEGIRGLGELATVKWSAPMPAGALAAGMRASLSGGSSVATVFGQAAPPEGQRRPGGPGGPGGFGGRGGGGGGGYGTIVDAGSVLLALTPGAQLVVFAPGEKEFKQVASYKVASGQTHAYPVVSGNRIFIKDKDSLTLWTAE